MPGISGYERVEIEKLIPYINNARTHGEDQITRIAASIREFGFLSPCVIDRTYNVIAGHGRILAAKKLGLDAVPCVYVEGLTDAQRKAYILADNRLAEFADWDKEIVAAELEALNAEDFDTDLTGFELPENTLDGITEDEAPEPEDAETRCEPGDVWQLGDHRLMCGDATSAEDVHVLLGGGKSGHGLY